MDREQHSTPKEMSEFSVEANNSVAAINQHAYIPILAPLNEVVTFLWCTQCVWVGASEEKIREELQSSLSIIFFDDFNEAKESLESLAKMTQISIIIPTQEIENAVMALTNMCFQKGSRFFCLKSHSNNVIEPEEFDCISTVQKIIEIFRQQIGQKGYSKIARNFFLFNENEQKSINPTRLNLCWMLDSCSNEGRKEALADFTNFAQKYFEHYYKNKFHAKGALNNFQSHYPIEISSEQELRKFIIEWYTKNQFFYKMINMVMRNFTDPTHFAYFRLPITDLFNAIRSLHENQKREEFECYRGCYLSQQQIALLEENVNNHLQLEGFISTSKNIDKARDFGKIMMIIKVPKYVKDTQVGGFAEIEDYADKDVKGQQQILFNPMNVYKIVEAKRKMMFTDTSSPQQMFVVTLEFVYFYKTEFMRGKNLITQGSLLYFMGKTLISAKFFRKNFADLVEKGLQQQKQSEYSLSPAISMITARLIVQIYEQISMKTIPPDVIPSSIRSYFQQNADALENLLSFMYLSTDLSSRCWFLLVSLRFDFGKGQRHPIQLKLLNDTKSVDFGKGQRHPIQLKLFNDTKSVDFGKGQRHPIQLKLFNDTKSGKSHPFSVRSDEELTQNGGQRFYQKRLRKALFTSQQQMEKLENEIIKNGNEMSYCFYEVWVISFLQNYIRKQKSKNCVYTFEVVEKSWRAHACPDNKIMDKSLFLHRLKNLQRFICIYQDQKKISKAHEIFNRYLELCIAEAHPNLRELFIFNHNGLLWHSLQYIRHFLVNFRDAQLLQINHSWANLLCRVIQFVQITAELGRKCQSFYFLLDFCMFTNIRAQTLMKAYNLFCESLIMLRLISFRCFYFYLKELKLTEIIQLLLLQEERLQFNAQQTVEQESIIALQLQLLISYQQIEQGDHAAKFWIKMMENFIDLSIHPEYFQTAFCDLLELNLSLQTKQQIFCLVSRYYDNNKEKFDIFKQPHPKFLLRFSALSKELKDYERSNKLQKQAVKCQYYSTLCASFSKFYLQIYASKLELPYSPIDTLINSISYISLDSESKLRTKQEEQTQQRAQDMLICAYQQIFHDLEAEGNLFNFYVRLEKLNLFKTRKLRVLSQTLNKHSFDDDARIVALLSLFHCTYQLNDGGIISEKCFEQFLKSVSKSTSFSEIMEIIAQKYLKIDQLSTQNKSEIAKIQLLKKLQTMSPQNEEMPKLIKQVYEICKFDQQFDDRETINLFNDFPRCCFHIAKEHISNHNYKSAFKYLALYLESLPSSNCVDELLFQLFQICYFHATKQQFLIMYLGWLRESQLMKLRNGNHQRLKNMRESLLDRVKNKQLKALPEIISYSVFKKQGKKSGRCKHNLEVLMSKVPFAEIPKCQHLT